MNNSAQIYMKSLSETETPIHLTPFQVMISALIFWSVVIKPLSFNILVLYESRYNANSIVMVVDVTSLRTRCLVEYFMFKTVKENEHWGFKRVDT